ncbi:efflux transporter, outer membrane factor lipoprotein, NodT family [Sphingobacterium spiritivorum ATCC 33300]|uniref:Efflux transporter, outer membrane factor lipoprotein, NodT family n=1 Tax=Sphingobacterium spiritivorum ATCC 33300 TaxID=525372 RepID=C2FXW4_SPHSI|nr:efflux transporter outer membrane subunit [Sphingobacterium spiritivorum]EEI92243.1 efflux transporter, outer membrane factor lipoprotein, NodT family [Sphingobacterium spiritivorum ATCC 33300]QQS96716.1 efflux transporter outer membrane subunit [Sphingobacterium spiritivorum]
MRSIINHIAMCIGTAVLLSSCAVGKPYSRPDLATPENYREQVQVTGDTVLLPWKTFFKDPDLVILIEQALEKNKDISVAMLNLQQLDLSYKQAKRGLLPTLNLAVGASRVYQSRNSLNGSLSEQFTGEKYMDDFSATLTASWEADIWGKVRMQKEAARANYLMQQENLTALKTRIIVQVAQAYYNLITLDEQLKIAANNIKLSDETLQMIRLQFQSAQVNSLGVEQAEAQKKTAELLVPLAKQNIAIQENALSILCGAYPDRIGRSAGLETYSFEENFPVGVPALLLSRRPDLKVAEYAVVVANANVGLSKVAMYPSISLTPSVGANSFKFNNWFDLPGSLVKNIAGNITQPIFQKKELQTNYEQAKIEQQKTAEQFRQSVMNAVAEVSDAMAKTQYTSERIGLVKQRKASLEKAVNDAMLLYKSGMATYLEVITAQNNSLENDLEAINIQKEKYDAVTELYRALGGGTK